MYHTPAKCRCRSKMLQIWVPARPLKYEDLGNVSSLLKTTYSKNTEPRSLRGRITTVQLGSEGRQQVPLTLAFFRRITQALGRLSVFTYG